MDPITLVPNNSLLTATPEEGRQLAVHMSRLVVKATQPDAQRRDMYANDAAMLLAVTHTVALEFATIAATNDYWRK